MKGRVDNKVTETYLIPKVQLIEIEIEDILSVYSNNSTINDATIDTCGTL